MPRSLNGFWLRSRETGCVDKRILPYLPWLAPLPRHLFSGVRRLRSNRLISEFWEGEGRYSITPPYGKNLVRTYAFFSICNQLYRQWFQFSIYHHRFAFRYYRSSSPRKAMMVQQSKGIGATKSSIWRDPFDFFSNQHPNCFNNKCSQLFSAGILSINRLSCLFFPLSVELCFCTCPAFTIPSTLRGLPGR